MAQAREEFTLGTDQTIVSAFTLSRELALDGTIYLDEPQAASTAGNKKTREMVICDKVADSMPKMEELLMKMGITPSQNLSLESISEAVGQISPPKTIAERLKEYKRSKESGDSDTVESRSTSLLSLNGISDKSSEHYLLSESSFDPPQHAVMKRTEEEPKKKVPAFTGLIRANNHLTDLSKKSLPSHIPACLLEAESMLGTSSGKEITNVWEKQSLPIDFNIEDISGRSTEFNAEASRLLNGSVNSLGSFGKDSNEASPKQEDVLTQDKLSDKSLDKFHLEQSHLSILCSAEKFDFQVDFDEAEKEFIKENMFNESQQSNNDNNMSLLSGIYNVQEITARPSWLESIDKDLIQSNNKIPVDKMFQSRSNKLGSLDDKTNIADRPSFGLQTQSCSPPGVPCYYSDTSSFSDSDSSESTLHSMPDEQIDREDEEEEGGESQFIRPTPQITDDFKTVPNAKLSYGLMKSSYDAHSIQEERVSDMHEYQSRVNRETTFNSPELETSVEVLLLKKQREALSQKWDKKSKLQHKVEVNPLLKSCVDPERTGMNHLPPRMGVHMQETSDCVKSTQQRHHEVVPRTNNTKSLPLSQLEENMISLPTVVNMPCECLVGIASEISIPISIGADDVFKVSIIKKEETLYNKPVKESNIFFTPTLYAMPNTTNNIAVSVCGQNKGHLQVLLCVCFVKVRENSNHVITKNVKLTAVINEPSIDLVCDNNKVTNFGVVLEGCKSVKMVTIINNTLHPIPIKLGILQQEYAQALFTWDENTSHLHKISNTQAACELEPALSKTSPTAITIPIVFDAPYLDKDEVDSSGLVWISGCQLQVELDTPDSVPIILSSIPILAKIAAVTLCVMRRKEPVSLESTHGQSSTTTVALHNASAIAVPLSLKCSLPDCFKISPSTVTVDSGGKLDIKVEFFPEVVGEVEDAIQITVEPDGLQLDVPLLGKFIPQTTSHLLQHSRKLQKSSSLPLSSQTKNMVLDSTKLRIVFGTVKIGETATDSFILKNGWKDSAIKLSVNIKGSDCFQLVNSKPEDLNFNSVILAPNERQTFYVQFKPTSIASLTAVIVFRPKEYASNLKFNIPIQGYGGSGHLDIPEIANNKQLVFDNVFVNSSSTIRLTVVNTGTRTVFVRCAAFVDKTFKTRQSPDDVYIHNPDFLLEPCHLKDIIITLAGSVNILSKLESAVSYLKIVYGDEIMRSRFRSTVSRKVKQRDIKDKSLLLIDWDCKLSNEEETKVEDDQLPPVPEDAKNFYNCCHNLEFPLYARLDGDSEITSTTMFNALAMEESISTSMMESNHKFSQSQSHDGRTSVHPGISSLKTPTTTPSSNWDVIPSEVIFNLAENIYLQNIFIIMNHASKKNYFEIMNNAPWLSVTPTEGELSPSVQNATVCLQIVNVAALNPGRNHVELQIYCEDECRCVSITVISNVRPGPLIQPPTKQHVLPHSSHSRSTTASEFNRNSVVDQNHSSTNRKVSHLHRQILHSNSDDLTRSDENEEPSTCLIDIEPRSIDFQSTKVMTANRTKFTLKNRDKDQFKITAKLSIGKVFKIKHFNFTLRPSSYVILPIFFHPTTKSTFQDMLTLVVEGTNKQFKIPIQGEAV